MNPTVVALLLELDPTTGSTPLDWQKRDGTFMSAEERELVGQATWSDLMAARELLALEVELEGYGS